MYVTHRLSIIVVNSLLARSTAVLTRSGILELQARDVLYICAAHKSKKIKADGPCNMQRHSYAKLLMCSAEYNIPGLQFQQSTATNTQDIVKDISQGRRAPEDPEQQVSLSPQLSDVS